MIFLLLLVTLECYDAGLHTNDTLFQHTKETWNNPLPLVLHVFLPLAGLALLWGKRDLLSKLLIQFDRKCIAVFCPSLSKRERLLKWASGRLPATWSSHRTPLSGGLAGLWKDGSLLCTLINSAVPEACPNPHRHFRKPPTHGQALAHKYLGVAPVFSNEELETNLDMSNETKFVRYLSDVQQAIAKLLVQNESKTVSYSSLYVARGMGLFTGERNRRTTFYIYRAFTGGVTEKVLISIRGPYGTYAKETVQVFQKIEDFPVVRRMQSEVRQESDRLKYRSLAQTSLLRTFSWDFSKLINASNTDSIIPLKIEIELDRAKVTFLPKYLGVYQINLVSNGELLTGCPFNVRITESGFKTYETFGDAIPTPCVTRRNVLRRKVVAKIIDCIDKKMDARHLFHKCSNNKFVIHLPRNLTQLPNVDKENDETIPCNNINDTQELIETLETLQTNPQNESVYINQENKIPDNTSPICPHIAPEVKPVTPESWQKKQTSLRRQPKIRETLDSFLETENESDVPVQTDDFVIPDEMDSRFSETSVVHDLTPGCVTDEMAEEVVDTKKLFKERREYWSKFCSKSTTKCKSMPSDLNTTEADVVLKTNAPRKLLSKSLEMLGMNANATVKKLEPADESIFPSVEDRKLQLLKNLTDEQKLVRTQPEFVYKRDVASLRKSFKLNRKDAFSEDAVVFTPISERIKIFNERNELTA